MIGRTLSHYRIVEKLGEGGMGVVYRAVDTRLDRTVAVKVLAPEAVADPERKKRFVHEARTASILNHPNIVTVHDIDTAVVDGRPVDFIAMEFVRGKTLHELIGGVGLSVSETVKYALQIADALVAAHAAGIIHRDLKPANIMVTEQELVKVLDFGLAKLAEPVESDPLAPTRNGRGSPPRTTEGAVLGTAAYMAPEQTEGKKVDARADIFAFGAVLYEMITGRRAFRGETRMGTMAAILRDDPRPPGQVVPGVPPALDTITGRCLRKDPERRFQTAADLRVTLREVSERRLLDELAPRVSRRRPPRRVGLVGAFLLALAAIGLGLAVAPNARRRLAEWLPSGRVPAQKQIAVLPFQNVGGDAANQAFCDGLFETLTTALTQLEQFHGSLRVVPASEVRRIGSAQAAQRSLGANLVITGSVQRAQQQVRVTANLVDAATLRQLGARTIDARLEGLTNLQDEVVRQVAHLLELELQPQAQRLLAAGTTARPGAYDLYLQARGALYRYDRQGNIETAITLFQHAAQQDPNYALAFAGLSEGYLRQYTRTKEPKWLDQAQLAGSRALELNDRMAVAHVHVGAVHAARGNTDAAIREFRRALELDPVNADAHRELANVYTTAGRLREAEATYRRAIQLRPSDWLAHTMMGIFYSRQNRYADAEPHLRRVTELTPDNPTGYRNLGGLYYQMGRFEEAARINEQSVAIQPSAAAYSNLGAIYFIQGRYREAVATNEKAVAVARANEPNDFILWGNLGDSYRWTPEQAEKAPDAYRKAIEAGQRHLAVNPKDARVLSILAVYHAKRGDNEQALAGINQAQRLAPGDAGVGFRGVLVQELTGRRARALALLEEVLKSGYSVEEIRREPELAQLRRDPRYHQLAIARDGTAAGAGERQR